MIIVIDANRVIAALIKDSTTRKILFNEHFEFVAPDYLMSELLEHKEEIMIKADIEYI